MKAGYTIDNCIFKKDKCIEVSNYKDGNYILNTGWRHYDNYLRHRDKNTVGVWKIKEIMLYI
jgi:hypothetical protein